MRGAVLVAIAATIGNLLQGWDNATIAGAVLYIKRDFGLQSQPTIEGLIVAMSLIGATVITTFSGAVADMVGRRPLLILSSVFYFISGLVMLWSPNVYVLLLARLIDGFGIGLAVTLVPVYISETAPSKIRGLLNTLPQFLGSGGMFLSYCMVFGMSLGPDPNWRVMLGVLSVPSLLFFVLTIFYLPESPRWLVSKGRMVEAKKVLRRLRGRDDVSGELAQLVEGLGVGRETSRGQSALGSALGLASRHGSNRSVENQNNIPGMDPLVTLIGSVHEELPEMGGSMGSMSFSSFGSMFSEQWDEEKGLREGEDYASDDGGGDSDDNLQSPLLSRQATSMEGKDIDKGPQWRDLFEPGVKRALIVGIGLQILQQFAGINGVLYYTPQILEQAGVGILLSDIGISSDSASFLISGLTTLLMLPAIGVAMRLMDLAGRRSLLLRTIPILIVSLIVLVVSNLVKMGSVVHAVLSTVGVIVYFCCFVMAFGPVPNILCAEIFPTRVRGVCIAICSLTFWFGDIVVTYTLPVMLNTIGLAGVFGIYAVVCVFALVFVYLKVPETKGMPLELITEFFALDVRQAANNEGTERSTVWLLEEQDADETEES